MRPSLLLTGLLIAALAPVTARARASVTPNPVPLDGKIVIEGAGFYPMNPVFLWWDLERGTKASPAGNVLMPNVILPDGSGAFRVEIPYLTLQLYPVDAGDHTLAVGFYGFSGMVEGFKLPVRITPRAGWPAAALPSASGSTLSAGTLAFLRYTPDGAGTSLVLADRSGVKDMGASPAVRGMIGQIAWSPDGSRIAFSASLDTDPYTNLYTLDWRGAMSQLTALGGAPPKLTGGAAGAVTGAFLAYIPSALPSAPTPGYDTCDDLDNRVDFPKAIRVNLVGTPFATVAPRPQGIADNVDAAYPFQIEGVPEGDYWLHASYLTQICQEDVQAIPRQENGPSTATVHKPAAAVPNLFLPIHVSAGQVRNIGADQRLISGWSAAMGPSFLDNATVYYTQRSGVFDRGGVAVSDIWAANLGGKAVQVSDTVRNGQVSDTHVAPATRKIIGYTEKTLGLTVSDAANPTVGGQPFTSLMAIMSATGEPIVEDHPAWSPDGVHVAFIRRDVLTMPLASPEIADLLLMIQTGAIGDLWTKNAATGEERQLTKYNTRSGEGAVGLPAWSPDRSQIAFTYTRDNLKHTDIRVVNVADGKAIDVTNDGRSALPAWSGLNIPQYALNVPIRADYGFNAPANNAAQGDLNGDGRVTVADAVLALRTAVGISKATADSLRAGDLDGDGRITVKDVVVILRKAVAG